MHEQLNTGEFSEEALDEAIAEALEGEPRAEEWRRMRNALFTRRERLELELGTLIEPSEIKKLLAEIELTDEQIRALHEEAELTQFVEDTIRFSAEVRRLQSG